MTNKFNPNEIVIALTNPRSKDSQPREKGKSYKIVAIKYCEGCGEQFVNIGPTTKNELGFCNCGQESKTYSLCWTYSKHFVRPQDIKEKLEECVAEEDYEMAAVLHEINQNILQK